MGARGTDIGFNVSLGYIAFGMIILLFVIGKSLRIRYLQYKKKMVRNRNRQKAAAERVLAQRRRMEAGDLPSKRLSAKNARGRGILPPNPTRVNRPVITRDRSQTDTVAIARAKANASNASDDTAAAEGNKNSGPPKRNLRSQSVVPSSTTRDGTVYLADVESTDDFEVIDEEKEQDVFIVSDLSKATAGGTIQLFMKQPKPIRDRMERERRQTQPLQRSGTVKVKKNANGKASGNRRKKVVPKSTSKNKALPALPAVQRSQSMRNIHKKPNGRSRSTTPNRNRNRDAAAKSKRSPNKPKPKFESESCDEGDSNLPKKKKPKKRPKKMAQPPAPTLPSLGSSRELDLGSDDEDLPSTISSSKSKKTTPKKTTGRGKSNSVQVRYKNKRSNTDALDSLPRRSPRANSRTSSPKAARTRSSTRTRAGGSGNTSKKNRSKSLARTKSFQDEKKKRRPRKISVEDDLATNKRRRKQNNKDDSRFNAMKKVQRSRTQLDLRYLSDTDCDTETDPSTTKESTSNKGTRVTNLSRAKTSLFGGSGGMHVQSDEENDEAAIVMPSEDTIMRLQETRSKQIKARMDHLQIGQGNALDTPPPSKWSPVYVSNSPMHTDDEKMFPNLENTMSITSPIHTIRTIKVAKFVSDVFFSLQLYFSGIFHTLDTATDLGVTINWLRSSKTHDFTLGVLSLFALMLYRCISSINLTKQFGWFTGLAQFADVNIYIEIYRSCLNKHSAYTPELKWIRKMESVFESAPQALLQLGYLLMIIHKSSDAVDILVVFSFVSSLISIALSIIQDDAWAFDPETNAVRLLSAVDVTDLRRLICCGKCKYRGGTPPPDLPTDVHPEVLKDLELGLALGNHVQHEPQSPQNGATSSANATPVVATPMTGTPMTANVSATTPVVPKIEVNPNRTTIMLPHYRYILRGTFRFVESAGRICTLGLIWVVFNQYVLACLIGVQLAFYSVLFHLGLLGLDFSNIVCMIMVHPNLTLREDVSSVENMCLLYWIGMPTMYLPLILWLHYDVVSTHYIHRCLETNFELFLVCLGAKFFGATDTASVVFEPFGFSILAFAWFSAFLTPLLHHYVIRNWLKDNKLEYGLFSLILDGDARRVQKFLAKSEISEKLLNTPDHDNETPAYKAASLQQFKILKILVKEGANINQPCRDGETPLFPMARLVEKDASRGKDIWADIYKWSTKSKTPCNPDFRIRDVHGWTPAFHAVEAGNFHFISWLCQNMVDALQVRDFQGRYLTHLAAVHDQHLIFLKLKKYIKWDIADGLEKLPVHYAIENSCNGVLDCYLREKEVNWWLKHKDIHDETPLDYIVRFGRGDTLTKLEGKPGTRISFNKLTLLAGKDGKHEILDYLIGRYYKGSMVNDDTHCGYTALHWSAYHDHIECIRVFIKYKNKVVLDVKDKEGSTPAFVASQRGNIRTLAFLWNGGADMRMRNRAGHSPLSIAKLNGHTDLVAFLERILKKGLRV